MKAGESKKQAAFVPAAAFRMVRCTSPLDEAGCPLDETAPCLLGESPGAHPPGDCDECQHCAGPGMTHDPPREFEGAACPWKC